MPINCEIKSYDPIKSATLVAGLLVDPKFHSNTVRIEELIHYIIGNCNGTKKPTHRKINSWLNDFSPISKFASYEDPVEDVFLTNVMTVWGDYRLFEGICESNDFCLQKVLDTIESIPNSFDLNSLFAPIKSILRLSEEIALRNKSKLYNLAPNCEKRRINVPTTKRIKQLGSTLIFTNGNLDNIDVSLKDLEPFIFTYMLSEKPKIQDVGQFRTRTKANLK